MPKKPRRVEPDMRGQHLILLALILICFALSGALGLTTTSQCDAMPLISQRISCYHTAAITAAYLGVGSTDQGNSGRQICNSIYQLFGTGTNSGNDIGYRAQTERDSCLFDVARISGNQDVCTDIADSRNDVSTTLFGDQSSKELCTDGAARTHAIIQMQNNWSSGITNDSLCNMVFILPLIAFGALRINNKTR